MGRARTDLPPAPSSGWARLLQRLAEDIRDRGKIDLSEAFVDATFAWAKKATATVFLSPCTWTALHRMSHTSSPPRSTRASSPTSRGV
jgi:hypothetical protein